jgi:hypothetical protein
MLNFVISLGAVSIVAYLVQIQAFSKYRLIRVIYVNSTHGTIKRKRLEECIVSGSIIKFFRSSGWVTIGVDPIRKTNRGPLRKM